MNTECMKCEEIISKKEFSLNQGLCDKCYIRLSFVDALNAHREGAPSLPQIEREGLRDD